MSDKHTSTDPAIEQEADRMLKAILQRRLEADGAYVPSGGVVEVGREDLLMFLRELAALRSRGGEGEKNKYNMNFAWVIEHAESEPGSPQYFTGKYTLALRWSNDNAEACRFSRKCDAERLARSLDGARNHRIAEHGWSEHNDPAKACENDTMQL